MKRFRNVQIIGLMLLLLLATATQAQDATPEIKEMIRLEQYAQADQQLKAQIALDDKNAELYYLQGLVYYKTDNDPAARASFEKGIKVRSKDPFNYAGLGMTLFRQGKKQEAEESLQKALELGKKDAVEVNFAVANAYLEEGSPRSLKEAEVLLLQAQNKAPDNPRGATALGPYYKKKGIYELALLQYLQAIEKDPGYAEGYVGIAEIHIEQGKYQEGAEMLNKALKADPDYAPAYKHMGELWLKAQDYEKARDNYKKYVELTGNDLYAQQRYASFLFLTRDYAQTVKVLESLDTTTNLGLRLLGMAYLELGEPQQSRAYMMRYFAQMKEAYTIPTDWLTRGKAQMAVGEEEGAMADFEKAQEMDPAQVEIWKDIADEAYKNKQYEREARFRRLYIENKADASPRDYYFLGQAQYRAEQYEAADSTFGTVVSMQDNLTDAHYYRIRIAQKLDPENEHWLSVAPAEKIVKYLENKEMGDLKASEHRQLADSYLILTMHAFNQQEDGTGDCSAIVPYLKQAMSFNPDNAFLPELEKYCAQN